MKPEEELKSLNKIIRQFESVYRSTTDAFQRDRVASELKKLKKYKEKLESFHLINPEELEDSVQFDKFQDFPFLKSFLDQGKVDEELYADSEVFHLSFYLSCFESEFLALLSETKLKLDFKYSLERDSFYHRFEKLRRQLNEFEDDTSRIELYAGQHEEEMRKRSFKKKRNLILDADRFFRNIIKFTSELIEDISLEGLMCLNSNEIIHFNKIESRKYLKGLPVSKALIRLNDFSKEVTSYLNVPQIEPQEK